MKQEEVDTLLKESNVSLERINDEVIKVCQADNVNREGLIVAYEALQSIGKDLGAEELIVPGMEDEGNGIAFIKTMLLEEANTLVANTNVALEKLAAIEPEKKEDDTIEP